MKVLRYVVMVGMLICPALSYAIDISISSSINISNAPANSKWQVECGGSTGVYNLFTRQFIVVPGVNVIPVSSIFLTSGNYFCRTAFVQTYGQSPYSNEVAITVLIPTLSAPSLSVVQ